MLDLINASIAIIALGNLALGAYSFLQNKKNKINRVFAYLSFSVVAWCITMIIYRGVISVEMSILGAKFLYASAAFIAYVFLLFTFVFPDKKNGSKNIYKILIAIPFIFIVVSCFVPNWIIRNVLIQSGQEKQIIFGLIYWFYIFYIPFYFSWGFFNLIKKYIKTTGLHKAQIRYIFVGSFASAFLGMITNLTLPTFGIFKFNWLGQILTIIFISFIAYAILRYRLMDIRLVIKRSTVYFLSVVLAAASGILIWIIIKNYLIALVFAVIVVQPIRWFLRKLGNKYLFASLYAQHETLEKLNKKITTIIDLDELLNTIINTIKNTLGVETIKITLENKNMALSNYFQKQKKPLVFSETKDPRIKEQMQILQADICLPLISKNQLQGIITIGKKFSREAYSKEDLNLLRALTSQASIAIENSRLYDQVKDLSQNLEKKVQEQTKDIKGLLNMKTELLDTISHQLRTPTSIFRGMLSMIEEKKLKDDHEREEFINKSLAAADRLVVIINSITEANELQGQELNLEYDNCDLDKIIKDTLSLFKRTAKEKQIELKYIKPEKELPKMLASEKYLQSALEKIIDNAVWYTNKNGRIIIKTELADNKIKIIIKDTGIGLTEDDKQILFKKFSKGRGAKQINVNSSGLGLFIAKKIITAHKGEITAESEGENKGSIFTITIPVMQGV